MAPANNLKSQIENILINTPGIKSKAMVKDIGLSKKEINSFLYNHPKIFRIDDSYCWYLCQPSQLVIKFESNCWIDSVKFENALIEHNNLLDSDITKLVFVIPVKYHFLLDASTKLLALCNQLILNKSNCSHGKKTKI